MKIQHVFLSSLFLFSVLTGCSYINGVPTTQNQNTNSLEIEVRKNDNDNSLIVEIKNNNSNSEMQDEAMPGMEGYKDPSKNEDNENLPEQGTSGKKVVEAGLIEGSIMYPKEPASKSLEVCAEEINTKALHCTNTLEDKKYSTGMGYVMTIPAGKYHVYAHEKLLDTIDPTLQRAYYTEFVTCGMKKECTSHKPIVLEVEVKGSYQNINPHDWNEQL